VRNRTDWRELGSCAMCNHAIYLLEKCLLEFCVCLLHTQQKVVGMDSPFCSVGLLSVGIMVMCIMYKQKS